MSHNIYMDRGNACIASFRVSPWHKLGTVFHEQVDGKQLLDLAHLNWRVLKAPLFAPFGNNTMEAREYRAIMREDTGEIFGIVRDSYEVFQNEEIMNVFEHIRQHIDSPINFTYEVAGAIQNHRSTRIWILARVKDLDYRVKDDELLQYLLITSTHDGTGTLSIFPTTIRVVCQNTMNLAFSKQKKNHSTETKRGGISYSIKHTKNMRAMVQQAVHAINETIDLNRFSREIHRALAEVPANKTMKYDFFNFIVDYSKDESKHLQQSKRSEAIREHKLKMLEQIWNSPTNQTKASQGTAWGLLQTGIEYVDFFARTRVTGDNSEFEQRFVTAQFGTKGLELKAAMQAKIVELAGVSI